MIEDWELGQSRQKAGFVAEHRCRIVIGMPALPVGKNQHARTQFAEHTRNLESIFPGVLDAAIGNVEREPRRHF